MIALALGAVAAAYIIGSSGLMAAVLIQPYESRHRTE